MCYIIGDKYMLQELFSTVFEKWRLRAAKIVDKNEEVYKLFMYELKEAVFSIVKSLGFVDKIVQSSVGRVYWAKIPWILIRDGRVSTGPRYGIYVVYLFSPNGKCLYLSICLGSENRSLKDLRDNAADFRRIINKPRNFSVGLGRDVLGTSADSRTQPTLAAKIWTASTIFSKKYHISKLPNDYQLENDLKAALESYQEYINLVSEEKIFEDLIQASKPEKIEQLIQNLLWKSKDNFEKIVRIAVEKIRENEYDGSRWSTLAFSISSNFDKHYEVSKIFEELVKKEPENPAYLNNLGVNYIQRRLYGSALECFSKAYAIDFKHRGHKKASELPAWKNLMVIRNMLDSKERRT